MYIFIENVNYMQNILPAALIHGFAFEKRSIYNLRAQAHSNFIIAFPISH